MSNGSTLAICLFGLAGVEVAENLGWFDYTTAFLIAAILFYLMGRGLGRIIGGAR